MKRLDRVLIVTGSIFLCIIMLFAPLAFYIFNTGHYLSLYENAGVFDRLNNEDVIAMTKKIFNFFRSQDDLKGQVRYIDLDKESALSFSDEEIRHMEDVKVLLQKI
ncbi:MAG: DUF1461 domain-containing protein, partial [Actinobacteria bacterium]|nr:DUF1461 domain-containing protein [Actinomycetota bacterium]